MLPLQRLFFLIFFICPLLSPGQSSPWNINGNNASTGDFFGTLNNQPLLFRVNNVERMRLNTNGTLQVNGMAGFGSGIATISNSGVFGMTAFTGDSTKVLTAAGTFRGSYAMTGWKRAGNNIVNDNGAFVGIGTNSPQFLLDVNGNVNFNGVISALGLNISDKLEADTIKGVTMMDVANTLVFSGGNQNEIYSKTGDLWIQTNPNYSGNLLLGAGTNARIGIGISTPQFKLDVSGSTRISGSLHVYRIKPLPGDSLIRFGDSTIFVSTTMNRIWCSSNTSIKGLGIGSSYATGYGLNSLAFGTYVRASNTADYAIVIGTGVISSSAALVNATPNSLAIGFNSTVPTVFVGPGSGAGTVGKVGIGNSAPQADFQLGSGINSLSFGGTTAVANLFAMSYTGFNLSRIGVNQWKTSNNGITNGGSALIGQADGSLVFVTIPTTGGTDQQLTDQQVALNSRFQVRRDGKVMIGDNPHTMLAPGGYRLYVGGGILTERVKVSTYASNSWADYVFDSTYVLQPLDSVQRFILANHHLPGIPAAAEVEANGFDLAAMDAALLTKIEELTLYMIRMQQEMEELRRQNAELQEKLDNK